MNMSGFDYDGDIDILDDVLLEEELMACEQAA